MLEIGSLIDGKYRILNKVGQGSMGVVYMAMNERANKTWAIKEVQKDGKQDFEVVKQGLIVETDMLKRLDHAHLPSIVDVIDSNESFLIVMDFIEGRTLKAILDDEGAQPQEDVIEWAKQLCDVLGYLHSRKPPIVYRDMKPSNVMLKPDGSVILFDFGTAREYKETSVEDTVCLGTRGYAAPEQYGGHGQTDARTDIYCLGATMYHLLTGHNPSQPPFEMYPIRQWNANLSSGLEAIILKCTSENPEKRYQSCAELLYALEHYWETDKAYRKKQCAAFRNFLIPASFAVIFGISSAVFYGLRTGEKNSTYEAYISEAKGSVSQEEELENYRAAIAVDPGRADAYMGLLNELLLADGVLTSEESQKLREILIGRTEGSQETYQEQFRNSNPEGYLQFAYEAGLSYYYRFEERGNKKNAKAYFEYVKDNGAGYQLEASKIARAERLYKISNYYSQIGIPDAAGDEDTSFGDYWEDLTAISEGNLVEADNPTTALVVYRELAVQIVTNTVAFKSAGITREQMEEQLENIKARLKSDFKNVNETVRSEMKKLEEAVEKAELAIQSTYAQVQGETEAGGTNGKNE